MDDLAAIRCAAQKGLPVMPGQVLALLDYIAEIEQRDLKSVIVIENFLQLRDEAKTEVYLLRPVVMAARAWAGAIERCDGVHAAELELLKAIKECEQ